MRKLLISLLFGLFLISFVSAQDIRFYAPQGDSLDIKEPCFNNGTYCSGSALCNLTIWDSNKNIIINNQLMTNQVSFHNYSLNSTQTSSLGEHEVTVVCSDGSLSNFETFYYEVNPQGIRPSAERADAQSRGIWALLGTAALLFIGFLFLRDSPPVKWTFFLTSIIFFVAGLNIIFISMSDEVINPTLINLFDSFSAFSFYFYWFAGGLLAIMWLMTFMNTWILKKNEENLNKYGGGMP